MIFIKKWQPIIFALLIFGLIGCKNNEDSITIQEDIIGTWSAKQDEDYDIYEFHEDGTGLLRDGSGVYSDYTPFTYNFVEDNIIEFSGQVGYSIFVEVAMPNSNQLSWDADVTGGYHIDFEKISECQKDTLADCMAGRWILFWPDDRFTLVDFFATGEGYSFVPEIEGTTPLSFQPLDADTILYQVENNEPAEVNISMPDNYKMIFEFSGGENETMTFYRLIPVQ